MVQGKSCVVFEEKNHSPIFHITVSRGEGQGLVLEPYLYSFDSDFPENKVWNYEIIQYGNKSVYNIDILAVIIVCIY